MPRGSTPGMAVAGLDDSIALLLQEKNTRLRPSSTRPLFTLPFQILHILNWFGLGI